MEDLILVQFGTLDHWNQHQNHIWVNFSPYNQDDMSVINKVKKMEQRFGVDPTIVISIMDDFHRLPLFPLGDGYFYREAHIKIGILGGWKRWYQIWKMNISS